MDNNTASSFTMDRLRDGMSRLSELSIKDECVRLPEIRTSAALVEQWRFPVTKKRRIRSKWAKRPENLRPIRGGFHDTINGVYYMHPDMKAELFAAVNKEKHGL